jgi:CheY-like chemotaxis protein
MVRHVSPDVPTVLLVDSTHDNRAIYAEDLRLHGFHPVEIGDTADGLALARAADGIVTAIRVDGGFDRVELVRRLRNGDGSTRDKPIIVLTACAFAPDQQRAFAAGSDRFLAKPWCQSDWSAKSGRSSHVVVCGSRDRRMRNRRNRRVS